MVSDNDAPISLALARRAKTAEATAAELKQRLERVQTENAELKRLGALAIDRGPHGYQCEGKVPGGGRHPIITIDENARLVQCRICKEVLDPAQVLWEYATQERRFAFALEGLRREHSRLTEEVAQLQKMRQNLRQQIRRGKKGIAEPAV